MLIIIINISHFKRVEGKYVKIESYADFFQNGKYGEFF